MSVGHTPLAGASGAPEPGSECGPDHDAAPPRPYCHGRLQADRREDGERALGVGRDSMEEPDQHESGDGGSWLGELSVITLIVSVAVFAAIAAFALMLIVEMFR